MNGSRVREVVTGVVAASLLSGGSFALGRAIELRHPGASTPAAEPTPVAAAEAPRDAVGRPSFAALVSEVEPAVVHIKVTSVVNTVTPQGLPPELFGEDGPFRGFPFGGRPPRGGMKQQGSGSGFIIRKDGVVITNNHVVDGAKEITVVLQDGRELSGRVLGRDAKTDLAVVKVEGHDLPVARLGDSDGVKVGDWVVAIGNPFGLSNTVTAGIVSAKGRAMGGPYDDFIQTDAPINPGNSGGPLFDDQGNVVGINSSIYTQSGGNIGIGFAVPINMAKKLVPELEEHGHVTRGWLGVSIQKLTPDVAEALDVDPQRGVLVAGVTPKSPAAKAGLQPGDIVTRYDGKALKDQTTLPPLVAATAIGTTVPVEIIRDGKTKSLDVTIARLDEPSDSTVPGEAKGRLGLRLRDLTETERERRELPPDAGVLVGDVEPGSVAAEAGIKPGDVVLRVNRTTVDSVDALKAEVAKVPAGKSVLLLVRPAEGNDRFVSLEPSAAPNG